MFSLRDVIELPISDVYDVSGWEVRKALGLLRNGNATLIEWLSSPVINRFIEHQIERLSQPGMAPESAMPDVAVLVALLRETIKPAR